MTIAAPMQQPTAIGARLDRLPITAAHVGLIAVIGFGFMFDMMETAMSAIITAVFSASPSTHPGRSALTLMLLGFFIGGSIGAPLLGRLADRIGRRATLTMTFALFGIFSVAAAMTTNFVLFAVIRAFGGAMLAAGPPLIWSYLADVLPAGQRGRTMMLVSIMGTLGGMMAPILTQTGTLLHPFGLEGWRVAMIIGGVAGVVLSTLLWTRPESPRWLMAKGREADADAACRRFENSRTIFQPKTTDMADNPGMLLMPPDDGGKLLSMGHRRRFFLLCGLQFCQAFGIAGFAILATTALVRRGFDIQHSLSYSAIIGIGMPLGIVIASVFIDKMERRALFVALSIALAITSLLFGFSPSLLLVLASGILFNLGISVYSTLLHIYGTEMFPTRLRSSAAGGAFAANRIGAACVPLILLPLLLDFGSPALFAAIAAMLGCAALLALIFGPRIRPGRALA